MHFWGHCAPFWELFLVTSPTLRKMAHPTKVLQIAVRSRVGRMDNQQPSLPKLKNKNGRKTKTKHKCMSPGLGSAWRNAQGPWPGEDNGGVREPISAENFGRESRTRAKELQG